MPRSDAFWIQFYSATSRQLWWKLLCCVSGLALLPAALPAKTRAPDGKAIYRQQCAKCHGRQGEGVEAKYKEPLAGDWSVEKLTRYISKSMPDDAPGTCVGEDAEAVAQFMHDAFYSRDAQARLHPARVELVRLTNRQYVNTVADLLRSFTGEQHAGTSERGLNVTYYNSRNFQSDKKRLSRIDSTIDFDFLKSDPEGKALGTNELSAQWRGSLLVEESGDHEFILKTANGARLWINGDEDPAIDAWVASGAMNEHRVVVRLIGGRSYPLKLDYFRFNDKTASVSLLWKPPHGVLSVIPKRNLIPARSASTFVCSVPFPPDDSSVGYERGVGISKAWDEATTQAALDVAAGVVKRLDSLSGSKPGSKDRLEKVESFCVQFVERAFRRPLSPELKRTLVSSHLRRAHKLEDGVKNVVLLTLKSPRFLYLGLDRGPADSFEIASRLSFGLWDSLPDRPLRELASAGKLMEASEVRAQAERMLKDPRARSKIQSFLHHWLQVNHVEDLSKDAELYPGFSPEIIADLRTSLNLFLETTFWSKSSDYRDLLLADTLQVNGRLRKFYGLDEVPPAEAAEFTPIKFSPSQRSGVITHPYLLSAFSYQRSSSPIHRGVFLTRNIVGRALRPPPIAVAFKDAEFAPNLSMREKVAELTRPDACQTCHSVINPLGFSLEHYDAVGRFRTEDRNRAIDAVSDYITDDGKTVRLKGARDIAEFAVNSEQAQTGFIEAMFHQVVKQPVRAYGSDAMARLRQSFVASQFNMQQLLVDIVTLSARHSDLVAKNP
jgi:mono/diheme cytochrome c family protein